MSVYVEQHVFPHPDETADSEGESEPIETTQPETPPKNINSDHDGEPDEDTDLKLDEMPSKTKNTDDSSDKEGIILSSKTNPTTTHKLSSWIPHFILLIMSLFGLYYLWPKTLKQHEHTPTTFIFIVDATCLFCD